MDKIAYLTEEEYIHTKLSFREVQKEKPRYHTKILYDELYDRYYDKMIPNKMTDTWQELQKEYNRWNKSKYSQRTIYFVYH